MLENYLGSSLGCQYGSPVQQAEQISNALAGTCKREPQIAAQVARLTAIADNLEKSIAELTQRTCSAHRNFPSTPESERKQTVEQMVPLAANLCSLGDRLDLLTMNISQLISSFEL